MFRSVQKGIFVGLYFQIYVCGHLKYLQSLRWYLPLLVQNDNVKANTYFVAHNNEGMFNTAWS